MEKHIESWTEPQFNIHSDLKRDIVLPALPTVGPSMYFLHFPFSSFDFLISFSDAKKQLAHALH